MRGATVCACAAVAYANAQPSQLMAHNDNRVAAFYYGWYGTPETDGKWMHWNHSVLPHWTPDVRAQYPEANFLAPHDIHAPFYPSRGLYSSKDASVIAEQMAEMKRHGIGTAIVSWWGRPGSSKGDSQGVVNDETISAVLDAAASAGMKVALHLEPYEGRSIESIRLDLTYVSEKYGKHEALLRMFPQRYTSKPRSEPGDERVVYFVYDSYHIPAREWEALLGPVGPKTVRGTPLDGVFIGLWLNDGDGDDLASGGFDGAYSYFATDGFSFGSTSRRWGDLARFCQDRSMLFVPSVAPGYDDSKIRPWNSGNRRDREGGAYYRRMWEAALGSGSEFVTVTSFNEWGEGTQIEPAVPRAIDVDGLAPQGLAIPRDTRTALGLGGSYSDYSAEGGPHAYLRMTREYARRLHARLRLADPAPQDGAALGGTGVQADVRIGADGSLKSA